MEQITTPHPCIKVAITDDHHMVIAGVQNVLKGFDHIDVIAAYTNATSLIKGLQTQVPDVLLLDVQLPDQQGHEIAKSLLRQYPQMRILVLSGVESQYYIQDMIKQGCSGYLLKNSADSDLLAMAIQKVYEGEVFLDPSIKEELLLKMLQGEKLKETIRPKITKREREVLQLIVQEFDNQAIANKLFISLRTVENHRYNLLQKLDVKNTVGLVKIALKMDLLD